MGRGSAKYRDIGQFSGASIPQSRYSNHGSADGKVLNENASSYNRTLQSDINGAAPNLNSGVEIKSMISSMNETSNGATGLRFAKSRANLNS